MQFNSSVFVFLFLPVTLLGLFLINRVGAQRWAMVWLILVSFFFYGWFKAIYLPLLAILIAFNYLCGAKLSRDCQSGRPRPALLAFGVAVNLGVLAYFKYMNFFIINANHLLGTHFTLAAILLPLGISFFIFQKIAYQRIRIKAKPAPTHRSNSRCSSCTFRSLLPARLFTIPS